MIMRQPPKNPQNYIAVDSQTSDKLHIQGFYPKYITHDAIYYIKSQELLDYMRKEGLVCKTSI